jgi:hypothetical protein
MQRAPGEGGGASELPGLGGRISPYQPCLIDWSSHPQVLSLNATFIGEGSRELAGAFRRGACKQLQELYLRNVYLKDSGVHDLITAFQTGAVGGTLQVCMVCCSAI